VDRNLFLSLTKAEALQIFARNRDHISQRMIERERERERERAPKFSRFVLAIVYLDG